MRCLSRHLTVLAGAALLFGADAAAAQTSDAPVSTAGSRAGSAPVEAGQAAVRETPAPPPVQPVRDISDLETAADHGRRAPLLGEYHGEVGGVVGTNGLRGAYGRIVARPNDHVAVDFRFSTLHQNGYPYDGYVYGPGARYRPDASFTGPDSLIPPGN